MSLKVDTERDPQRRPVVCLLLALGAAAVLAGGVIPVALGARPAWGSPEGLRYRDEVAQGDRDDVAQGFTPRQARDALSVSKGSPAQELPRREFSGELGQGRQRMPRETFNLESGQVAYDGRFTFARLRFQVGDGGRGFGGFRRGRGGFEPPWSHDYPRAERNFMKIIKEISTVDPYLGPEGGTIVDIGSAELFKYPVAYMAEAGFWAQTDEEAANLRAYLQKGGFIIFDDYRGGDWINFEQQMARVLPGARLVELDVSHPIFHSFFDIESLDFVQFYGRNEPALFYGIFEDNDPAKRLLVIANYNNDIGEYWEYSDTGWTPIDLSNEAYKFGVNYIVYALTH